MDTFRLNRTIVTGKLDSSTPLCVLSEICDAMNVKHSNDYYHINNIKTISISCLSKRNLRILARYINSKCLWNKKSLINAYKFMHNVNREFDVDKIGKQKPGYEDYSNCCVVYSECKKRGIKTSRSMNISTMCYLIKVYDNYDIKEVNALLFSLLKNKIDVINCISCLNINIDYSIKYRDNIDFVTNSKYSVIPSFYKRSIPTFNQLSQEINRQIALFPITIKPKTNIEAICFAAIKYGVDISDSLNPFCELERLKILPYNPFDQNLKQRKGSPYKELHSLYLREHFNPKLPQKFYTRKHIFSLLENYSVDCNETFESGYTIMQYLSLVENFYEGRIPLLEEKFNNKNGDKDCKTIVTQEDLSELNDNQVICYGVPGGKYKAYEIQSLIDCFKFYKHFRDPATSSEMFSDISIIKLLHICNKRNDLNELMDIIIDIKSKSGNLLPEEIIFRDKYFNADIIEAREIVEILQKFFELSMYMRGWDGSSSYPIGSSPVEDQNAVNIRVTDAIHKFEDCCNNHQIFLDLPLYRWIKSEGKYYRCTDKEKGLTIRQRLNLVKTGKSVYSCIRLTSNWFACTACFYFSLIKLPNPIDISKLRSIG